ncbi:MAG: pitrilysin family protein [Rhizomicrobium sp.]
MHRLLMTALIGLALAFSPAAAMSVKAIKAPKGSVVWLAEDHTVPVIAMTASLPAGSAYDPSTKAGLAAMAAALLEEGAGSLDGDAFHNALDERAVELTATPDRDRLVISLKVLSPDAREVFRMLGLALSRPRFDYDAITRVRLSMMQDLDREHEDPSAVAWNSFFALYFGAHPYGHPVEGAKPALASISREDLRGFVASHWVAGDIKIAIAGDVDEKTAAALARSAFGALPLRPVPAVALPRFVGAAGQHVMAMQVSQSDTIFALPGFTRRDPDFLAGLIANTILGGAEESRLSRALRENRGLTYDVSTDLMTFARAGLVLGEVQTKPEKVRATLAIVRQSLRQFAMTGPTTQEFADAKSYVRGSFPLAFASNEDIATTLAGFMADGLPVDYVERHGALIDAVSFEDVKRAARRLYASDKLTVVVAGSAPAQKRSSNPFRE